ncbi:MAG: 3-isopropylmalate dehydratase small subunit [Acidimicrobiales bacterium]
MKAVRVLTGRGVPLRRSDVDTDQIIPSDWLKRVERTGFGKGLFSEWRDDRRFVLNDEVYAGASILVAGPNFGTGSSREHAVWALMDYGFDAVISPRFGEIFRNNSTKNGLVPIRLEPDEVERLMSAIEADPELEITIDIERRSVSAPRIGLEASFPIDDATQHRFLNGLDDISLTLQHAGEIDAYETNRPSWLPIVR